MQSKRRLVVLEMEEVNQLQKAGKDSQQIQIGNVIINSAGITEERARAVFNEMIPQALANYTEEAQKIATERVNKLEERIMPQINQVEGLLPAFADPAFQVLLRKAQQKAAITERENDYDLLTELLVCHVQKGNDILMQNDAFLNYQIFLVVTSPTFYSVFITFAVHILQYFAKFAFYVQK